MPDIRDFNKFLGPADVEDGDILEIMDAGKEEITTYGKEDAEEETVLVVPFKLPNGKVKRMSMNRTNRETIGEKYGPHTEDWVGHHVQVVKFRQNSFGTMKDVIRLKHVEEPSD